LCGVRFICFSEFIKDIVVIHTGNNLTHLSHQANSNNWQQILAIHPNSNRGTENNNQTLEDITHLQKIFTKNPNLFVSDFQGLIGEDGQLHIMDPQGCRIINNNNFILIFFCIT
jgi:hypothetical protein